MNDLNIIDEKNITRNEYKEKLLEKNIQPINIDHLDISNLSEKTISNLKLAAQELTEDLEIKYKIEKMTPSEIKSSILAMTSTSAPTAILITAGIMVNNEHKKTNYQNNLSRKYEPYIKNENYPKINIKTATTHELDFREKTNEIAKYNPQEKIEFIKETTIPKPRDRNQQETDEDYEKYLRNHYARYITQFRIIKRRKPKFKDKIKKILGRSPFVSATIIALTFGMTCVHSRSNSLDTKIQTKKETSINKFSEKPIDKRIDELINFDNQETIKKYLDEISKPNENTNLNIGSIITLNENLKIYKNFQDACFEENSYRPYFYNNIEKRTILGVSILYNNEIVNIFAYMENANSKINYYINNGGNIISVLTGNIEQNKFLKEYNGEKLSVEEINNNAEGWYNINSVEGIKRRGYSK